MSHNFVREAVNPTAVVSKPAAAAPSRRRTVGILTRKLKDVTLNQKSMSLSFHGKLKLLAISGMPLL